MQEILDPSLIDTYVIPWSIKLAMAVVIFVVGRMVVSLVCGLVNRMA